MGQGDVWEEAVNGWLAWMRAAGRPQTTLRLRQYQLGRFARDHGNPWQVTPDEIVEWMGQQGWSNESRRSYRSALRGFYGWALLAGRVDRDPTRLLPPVRHTVHHARPTPERVVTRALATAAPRVRLMILLAAHQGLRRGEIARLHTEDVEECLTGWSLRIHGKGGKERVVPLSDDIAVLLRSIPPGWVFPSQIGGHLSPRWVGDLVADALGEPGWTCHTLRHRFATVAFAGIRDVITVQEWLGHAKTDTTRGYIRLPDDAMRSVLAHVA